MRPLVDISATEGTRIPGRWSQAPSFTGLGRSGGNGKAADIELF